MIIIAFKHIMQAILDVQDDYNIDKEDEKYIDIINNALWKEDGTCQGIVADYQGKRYHLTFSKIILDICNRSYGYNAYFDFELHEGSKYDKAIFCHRALLDISATI